MKVPRWKHPSESEYSIACSKDCSGSSYFDSVSESQTSIMTISESESSVTDAESLILSQSSTLRE